MRATLKTLWFYWKRFGHRLGRFQTEIVMTLSYFMVFGPGRFGLLMARSDPLTKRLSDAESLYSPKTESPSDVESYKQQF